MKKIDVDTFKRRCLAILDDLDAQGVVITRCGEPVATLKPYMASMIGALDRELEIVGDVLSTGEDWDAQRRAGA